MTVPDAHDDAPRILLTDRPIVTPAAAAVWPARTWSPTEIATAVLMNQIRDQLNDLHATDPGQQTSLDGLQTSINAINAQLGCASYTLTTPGTVNNYPLDCSHRAHFVFYNHASADCTLTGFNVQNAAFQPQPGDLLFLQAGNAGKLFLANQGASNQPFLNAARTGPTPLYGGNNGRAVYVFGSSLVQGGYWTCVQHDQGYPIGLPVANLALSAAGGGGGTYTCAVGNINQCAYYIKGTTVKITIQLTTATVTGSPTNLRHGGWPFNFMGNVEAGQGNTNNSAYAGGWGPCHLSIEANNVNYVTVYQLNYGTFAATTTMYLYFTLWTGIG